jgi:aspartate-semialdehyde dehydrogenase
MKKRSLRIAIVGATGLVGRELITLLERRRFPVGELLPFHSGRKRASVKFRGRKIPAQAVSLPLLKTADLTFMVSSDEVSLEYGPALAKAGKWVIDDSSAFRLDSKVPLIIPEVNADRLSRHSRLIAGPNCTLTGAAVAGLPLIKAGGIRSVRIASYQAVSGAGKAALEEFANQSRAASTGRPVPAARALPRRIAMNLFPQVGSFNGHGHSSEESKVMAELRKIWGLPKLPISVTATRVPVERGHSLSFWIETRKPISPLKARQLLQRADGVKVWPEGNYPTPLEIAGSWPVHVGRIRPGTSKNELCLWVVSDNLLKGAALNSIQIAEALLKRGWL